MDPSEEQLKNREQALNNINAGVPQDQGITSTALADSPSLDFGSPGEVPVADVTGLNSDLPTLGATGAENQAQGVNEQLQALNNQLLGESALTTQLEEDAGISELIQQQTDLSSRLTGLKNEALAIPLQLQQDVTGRGVTSGGLQPLQASALRKNAIQALSVSSLLEATRGNLSTAYDLVDRAVAQKYDPIKEAITVKQKNLQLILDSPEFDRQDKERALQMQAKLDAEAKAVAKQEAETKSISDTALLVLKYGGPQEVAERIMNTATSERKAYLMAGKHLQDPQARADLETSRLTNELRKSQINQTQYETSLLKKYGGLTPSQYADTLKADQKAIDDAETQSEKDRLQGQALDGQVTLLGTILDSRAIDSVVGPTALARGTTGFGARATTGVVGGAVVGAGIGSIVLGIGTVVGGVVGGIAGGLGLGSQGAKDHFSGDSDALIGQTEQFISKKFLQSLIDVKAQGATFGALQKAEQDALTAAATFVGQRRIYKGKGEDRTVVGYDMSEEDFKRELSTIQTLTRTAYERAVGKSFTDDEDKVLNDFFDNTLGFNPEF